MRRTLSAVLVLSIVIAGCGARDKATISNEFGKYEATSGLAQKSMDAWQKSLDKTVADARKRQYSTTNRVCRGSASAAFFCEAPPPSVAMSLLHRRAAGALKDRDTMHHE